MTIDKIVPVDFTLPTEAEETLSFDHRLRIESNCLLYFFRGWW